MFMMFLENRLYCKYSICVLIYLLLFHILNWHEQTDKYKYYFYRSNLLADSVFMTIGSTSIRLTRMQRCYAHSTGLCTYVQAILITVTKNPRHLGH